MEWDAFHVKRVELAGMAGVGLLLCVLGWRAFHVKQGSEWRRHFASSMSRFWRSLGETPGILPACANVAGLMAVSFSRDSNERDRKLR